MGPEPRTHPSHTPTRAARPSRNWLRVHDRKLPEDLSVVPSRRYRACPAGRNGISVNDAGKLVLLTPHNGAMDDAVRDDLDAIAPEHRPLFDRLHRLVLDG